MSARHPVEHTLLGVPVSERFKRAIDRGHRLQVVLRRDMRPLGYLSVFGQCSGPPSCFTNSAACCQPGRVSFSDRCLAFPLTRKAPRISPIALAKFGGSYLS